MTPILGAKQGSVPTEFGGICANATAASCASGNGSLPSLRWNPNSPKGEAIRVGLPNRNGVLSSQVTSLTWGTPTNYQPVRQFRFSLQGDLLAMKAIFQRALLLVSAATVLALTGCLSAVQPDCQTLTTVPTPTASDGYVLHFVRSGRPRPGATPRHPKR